MYKNVLQAITGIELYPLISFIIFFAFFIGLLGYVLIANRNHINDLKQMPLNTTGEMDEEGGLKW
jgi:succinate dehydrogenase hydrophobic anchor subunit